MYILFSSFFSAELMENEAQQKKDEWKKAKNVTVPNERVLNDFVVSLLIACDSSGDRTESG